MKQISIKLDNEQYEKLQIIGKKFKIDNVSWLIRRSIDLFIDRYEYYREEDMP